MHKNLYNYDYNTWPLCYTSISAYLKEIPMVSKGLKVQIAENWHNFIYNIIYIYCCKQGIAYKGSC